MCQNGCSDLTEQSLLSQHTVSPALRLMLDVTSHQSQMLVMVGACFVPYIVFW